MTFATMIAGLESYGLTRDEIAAAAGVSRATLWRMADGNRAHLVGYSGEG